MSHLVINVLQYLEDAAQKYPEKIVFSDEAHSVSYREAQERARAIGSYLAERGIRKSPVAVYIGRDIESILLFLGAVYSGNFYVPIDPAMPEERIRLIFDTLSPAAVLAADGAKVPAGPYPVIAYEMACAHAENAKLLEDIRSEALDTDPLYAIFTSGSTGVPKGVLVNHRSVIDLAEQFARTFSFGPEEVFGNQAPFDFDVSVKDIYSTLKNEASMHIIPRICFSFPAKLITLLNERRITTVIWAASAMRLVENFKALEAMTPQYLKKVMFSGEVMPVKVLNYWRRYLPAETMFVNLYGPTEITCNCTYYIVDRAFAEDEMLPVGRPFANTGILVLNEDNRPVTGDEKGEICVRGTCLAAGYYNNPEKTAEAFCQNPLQSCYPERIYRTGDIGQYNERGELLYLCRKDFQIKHMGHRIELGEVETAVNALPFVQAACCLYDEQKEKIVCFYQAEKECKKEIVDGLCKKLPKYMWPNRFVHFTEIPMNKNAKIDRARLKKEYLES